LALACRCPKLSSKSSSISRGFSSSKVILRVQKCNFKSLDIIHPEKTICNFIYTCITLNRSM
jgi:hypothetical protein